MTLASDLELLRSMATVAVPDQGTDPLRDEHARYQLYLEALSLAPPEREREAIAAVLRDPDRIMAEAAVSGHVDRKATLLPSAGAFAAWAAGIADLIVGFDFLTRRVREWELFKRLADGDAGVAGELDGASDWLQLKVAREVGDAAVLGTLAEAGRTKRIRNTARSRAGRAGRRQA